MSSILAWGTKSTAEKPSKIKGFRCFFIFAKKQQKRENHKFSSANSTSANRQGRYTNGVDDVLCKIITAKKENSKSNISEYEKRPPTRCKSYSYLRRWQKCSKNVIRKFRNTRNCSVTNSKILTSYSVMHMADRWRAK